MDQNEKPCPVQNENQVEKESANEQGFSEETLLHAAAAFGSFLWVGGIILPLALYYGMWETKKELKPILHKIVDFQISIVILSILMSFFIYQGITTSDFEEIELKMTLIQRLPSLLMLIAFIVPGLNCLRAHKKQSTFYPNFNPGLTRKVIKTFVKNEGVTQEHI